MLYYLLAAAVGFLSGAAVTALFSNLFGRLDGKIFSIRIVPAGYWESESLAHWREEQRAKRGKGRTVQNAHR